MRLMDLYYKAFKALRKHTEDDNNSQKLRKLIAHSNYQQEIFTAIKYQCKIEADWIENIEEGLIYVEKAIREDRQFIRTEGEVVPIEKVKKVSKATIEHLSRHSDLITREPKEKEDLIPDKLYIVEKLNDFLVYENRFIYMLLLYLKDFIQMRLDKIKDKTTTYESEMKLNKDINANQRHMNYKLDYHEIYKNDPFLVDLYKQIPLVDRIENIYAIAVSLLATPLMKEVSKAPVIKPPVVKTNVLRMNQNFRASLKLYDYIMSYNKDGYTFKEVKKIHKPLPSQMSDEIAETIELNSFIAYMEGNDLRSYLDERFQEFEKELEIAKHKKLKDEIKRLKKRIVEMHEDPAEYILKLEKRNAQLEKDSMALSQEQETNRLLNEMIGKLEKEKVSFEENIHQLNHKIGDKNKAIDKLNQKYFDDMTEAESIHQKELSDMKTTYEKTILELNEAHQLEIQALHEKHEADIQALHERYQMEKQALIDTHQKEKQAIIEKYQLELNELEEKIKQLNDNIQELEVAIEEMIKEQKQTFLSYQTKINAFKEQLNRLDEEKKYAHAQYTALKSQQGLLSDQEDFTSKEKFKQLEAEMTAYKKLFKEQWKKTKLKIREEVKKDVLSDDTSKKQDDQNYQ